MDIKEYVTNFISQIDSPEKVYELFQGLGYPTDKILDPSYKRKIDEFDFAKEEREKIKDIYTVFNYDGKLQIFLIETKTLSVPLVRYLSKNLSDRYLRFLLILTSSYKEYTFVFPEFERIEEGKHKLKLTRLIFDREYPYHTDLLAISNIALKGDEETWRDIWIKWKNAFSVKKVTDEFFGDYKNAFFELRTTFEKQKIPVKEAHELSQQFLNRLMFLYFISKKRWLNDDPKFMKWYWERYKEESRKGNTKDDTFYENWLSALFLEAFNNKYSHSHHHPSEVKRILADAPYLNGGLFHTNDLDNLSFHISDNLFGKVFGFFEKYHFTIREDLPLDFEVAVDPQMIGYVYESLSNVAEEIYERQDLGIFYTPTIEVDFMCRRSLVEYLSNHLTEIPKDWNYKLLFDEDKKDVEEYFTKKDLWYRLEEVLDNLAMVDPACGSGAFLVGMLHVVVELYRLAYIHIRREINEFELKKKVIGNSLYGVDVMPWATHSAELRLWLQLIIEEDIPYEDRKLYPLLPNLNLRLRIGDSLVQEVGGVSLHVRDSKLSPSLKRKLSSLKTEKEKYYNNDDTAKFKTDKALLQEELRIFGEILEDRIITLQKEIQSLEVEKRQIQFEMFEEQKKEAKQKHLFEEQIKDKEREIEQLKETKRKIQAPEKKPFVWDIDFAEIFGDKGGFDIVIGNPPYVRQEKIAPPNKLKSEVTLEDKREYKEKLLTSIQAHFPFIKNIDKKSDYYIYFYFHGLSLLNEKGTFCFITSNSWLDVGYGKDLQEFLLEYCHIKAVYDNEAKRSFEHADVNTIIAIFGPPHINRRPSSCPAVKETARFIMFKRPIEEVVNTKNLLEIEKTESIFKTDAYRVYPMKQETLLEEGWEQPEGEEITTPEFIHNGSEVARNVKSPHPPFTRGRLRGVSSEVVARSSVNKQSQKALLIDKFQTGKYEGNKWGGKYLRAPDIFFTILEKGKEKLVKLGDIAEVRRGFTTGCNEFFYLPSKHFNIKKNDKYYELIPKHEGLPKGIGIEEEYLKPVIKSPLECKQFLIKEDSTSLRVVMFNENKKKMNSKKIIKYINWGEQTEVTVKQGTDKGKKVKGFCNLETTKNKGNWYSLGKHKKANAVWVKSIHDNHGQAVLEFDGYIDQRLYEISFYDEISSDIALIILNNSIFYLFKELGGRANLGEGVLDTTVYEAKKIFLLDPSIFNNKKIEVRINRESKSIFQELGIDSNIPIREQEPIPLPDRKALDDVVFDILGLTQEERNEVYWSVCELVNNRLKKARSV